LFADGLPVIENTFGYVANKALPVVQNVFTATSQVSGDLSRVEDAKLQSALKAVGVDKLAAQAGDVAREGLTQGYSAAARQLTETPLPSLTLPSWPFGAEP